MLATKRVLWSAVSLTFALAVGAGALEFPKIDRRPAAANWGRGTLTSLPHYDPNSGKSFQMDLRSYDMSSLDLRDRLADLLHADFDDRTKWPEATKLPGGTPAVRRTSSSRSA